MDKERNNVSTHRTNFISWEEYFMALAILAAERSKDPDFRVGACIVNDNNQIMGIGYNGAPIGWNDGDFPWKESRQNNERKIKHLYVCHAEMNAISFKSAPDVRGCTMYVTLSPCNECAKVIVQNGIKRVVYLSDEKGHKEEFIAGKELFKKTKVTKWEEYKINTEQIILDFKALKPQKPSTAIEPEN